jgi:hypothetical protein
MSLEESIRKIVGEEIRKAGNQPEFVPLADFCREKKISRVTVWRQEKLGTIKLSRIGRRIFVNTNQLQTT